MDLFYFSKSFLGAVVFLAISSSFFVTAQRPRVNPVSSTLKPQVLHEATGLPFFQLLISTNLELHLLQKITDTYSDINSPYPD